jgi:hypothetical protein
VPVAQGAQEIQRPIFNINRGIVNRKMKVGYAVPRNGAQSKERRGKTRQQKTGKEKGGYPSA